MPSEFDTWDSEPSDDQTPIQDKSVLSTLLKSVTAEDRVRFAGKSASASIKQLIESKDFDGTLEVGLYFKEMLQRFFGENSRVIAETFLALAKYAEAKADEFKANGDQSDAQAFYCVAQLFYGYVIDTHPVGGDMSVTFLEAHERDQKLSFKQGGLEQIVDAIFPSPMTQVFSGPMFTNN